MKQLKIKNAKLKKQVANGSKAGNHKIRELGKGVGQEVGLVELVPPVVAPMEAQKKSEAGNRGRGRERGGLGTTRAELVAVLEEFGISPSTFDGLRSDAYEKHIAGRSLAELKSVYLTLLKPIEGSEELKQQFPRWSPGHRFGGQLPSINTLMGIKNRIMAEQTANGIGNLIQQVQLIHDQTAKLPGILQGQVFNAMLAVISQELFKAKFDGKPMSENLGVVDRLMKAAVIRIRERQGDKRNEQRDKAHKIQEGRLALARKKQAAVAKSLAKEQPDERPLSQETPTQMIARVWGENPFEAEGQEPEVRSQEPEGTVGQAGPNMNHEGAKAQSEDIKFQNPEAEVEIRTSKSEIRADDRQPSGNEADNREIREQGEQKPEANSNAEGGVRSAESKANEGQKPEASVTLESTAPKEPEEKPAQPIDTRPEWAKKPGNLLIGGPSKWHPMGVKKHKNKPVDAATGAIIRDMSWCSFIGFGGDGEKQLD